MRLVKQNNALDIQQYHESQHPYFLPQFKNLFSWSLPFVSEKVAEIFHSMLEKADEEEGADSKKGSLRSIESNSTREDVDKKAIIRKKIRFVAKMLKFHKILRNESETLLEIKHINNNKLPKGILSDGNCIIERFKQIRMNDMENEGRPSRRESF